MRAYILAAGLGTRLGSLSDALPKCMIPVAGKPVLETTIEHLVAQGITEFAINLCREPSAVISHFGDGHRFGASIEYFIEEVPLGTAGGLRRMAAGETGPFVVWYGDNLSSCSIAHMHHAHLATAASATIAVWWRADVSASGLVSIDSKNRITSFTEKPAEVNGLGGLVNAGIYCLNPSVLSYVPDVPVADLGRDVFPALLRDNLTLTAYTLSEAEGLWWIDRVEDLARTRAQRS